MNKVFIVWDHLRNLVAICETERSAEMYILENYFYDERNLFYVEEYTLDDA